MMSLRHIGIVVRDIYESENFYQMLGYEVVTDVQEDGRFIDEILGLHNVKLRTIKMKQNNHMIELLYYENPIPDDNFKRVNFVGCTHFAVTVDDVDKLYENLMMSGVDFIREPISNGKVKVAFCKDPNDVYIELVEEL
ncbi:MAG: hypothetical protein CBE47_00610 [Pelagibacteraceae bacterium TMED287]|nr:MAG: hypothetical protein CBE47_00610 [Pelagibacteraceae bacterium TMED287]